MLTALAALAIASTDGRPWEFVKGGILSGISGMALVEGHDDSDTFLIVHDNKKEGEARTALVTVRRGASPVYAPVAWEGETPIDLEGLTAIPGQASRYVALASAGKAFVIDLSADHAKVVVERTFTLPSVPQGANFEGLAVQKIGDSLVMAWGHRGNSPDIAKIFLSTLDAALTPAATVASMDVPVPWPAAQGARGISDLKIDATGTIFLTSAVDAGDDGPFQSALFTGGVVTLASGRAQVNAAASTRLFWTDQHKIEAFDLLPGKFGGLIFGTDDENLGSCVWNNFWPE